METIPPVIARVVANDLCIGCGVCAAMCPSEALGMTWSATGFLVATQLGECDADGTCIQVCPFNPQPDADALTEAVLAPGVLPDSPHEDANVGRYHSTYVGYSKEYRPAASSGGLATYVTATLLREGVVDRVITVRAAEGSSAHYEYSLACSEDELRASSRTRYFPVTADHAIRMARTLPGNVAFVGIGCFVKAVRLAQRRDPVLAEKVRFVVGIICGGVKSSFFTEYLANKAGTAASDIVDPGYRVKDMSRPASDYSFEHTDGQTGSRHELRMRVVGDMWGTGLFKANACDFCEDVTTELADISLGDAWLTPFVEDGRGTSVIVTRSRFADRLIQDGIARGDLALESLPFEQFKSSQQGSFNHRQYGLPVRLALERLKGRAVPPKRFAGGTVPVEFQVVQVLRRWVRARSLSVWRVERNSQEFDRRMKIPLSTLRFFTRFYRRVSGVRRRMEHMFR